MKEQRPWNLEFQLLSFTFVGLSNGGCRRKRIKIHFVNVNFCSRRDGPHKNKNESALQLSSIFRYVSIKTGSLADAYLKQRLQTKLKLATSFIHPGA